MPELRSPVEFYAFDAVLTGEVEDSRLSGSREWLIIKTGACGLVEGE